MIRSLDSFTVSVDYGRAHTTFNVHADGRREPVARMHKDEAYDHMRKLYGVYTGAQLSELIGYVQPFAAIAADRTPIGKVDHKRQPFGKDHWVFTQNDLGVLTGTAAGISSKAKLTFPLNIVLDRAVVDAALAFRLHFRSPESKGFEMAREAGVRATYAVKIHDARVNRLLVLALIAQFNTFVTSDLRKEIVDLTANPFKA